MPPVVIVYLGCAVLSTAGLIAAGITPAFPRDFLIAFALQIVPLAWATGGVLERVSAHDNSRRYRSLGAVSLGAGLAFLVWYRSSFLLTAILVVAFVTRLVAGPVDRSVKTTGWALLAFLFMNVAVRDCNYLVLLLAHSRLQDGMMRYWDEGLYRMLLVAPADYGTGLFPLVSGGVFRFFENAYFFFFPELVLIIFLLARRPPDLRRYFWRLGVCYVVAFAVFLVFPVVGPPLQYPSSFNPSFRSSATFRLMQSNFFEFDAVAHGRQPVSGFGYFIGMPSLHAAVAVLVQVSVRRIRTAFWFLLPINAALVLSTFLLGQHYVVDAIGGVLLVPLAFHIEAWIHRLTPWSHEEHAPVAFT